MNKIGYIVLFYVSSAAGQRLPDYGFNRIRLTEEDRTLLIETNPVTTKTKPSPENYYFWYTANTVHSTQGGYSGKLLNGAYKEFFLNKNLKSEGFFKNGLKTGVWKSWTENGILTDWITWDRGKKNGEFRSYNDRGNVIRSGNYEDDLYQGRMYSFEKDSVISSYYLKGKLTFPKRSILKRLNIFRRKSVAKDSIKKPL